MVAVIYVRLIHTCQSSLDAIIIRMLPARTRMGLSQLFVHGIACFCLSPHQFKGSRFPFAYGTWGSVCPISERTLICRDGKGKQKEPKSRLHVTEGYTVIHGAEKNGVRKESLFQFLS